MFQVSSGLLEWVMIIKGWNNGLSFWVGPISFIVMKGKFLLIKSLIRVQVKKVLMNNLEWIKKGMKTL